MQYRILLSLTFLLTYSCKDIPVAIPDARINDYALYDETGGFHRLSTYNDSKAIILFVQGNGCPIVRNTLVDFNNVVDDYSSKGFKFFMINSNIQDNKETIARESTDYKFNVPVLLDTNQLIGDKLNIKITSEVIVLHPSTREVLYRGPLNNRLDYETQKAVPTEIYLRDALDALLKGQTPTSEVQLTRGCKVTRLKNIEKDTLTFTSDIAPILKDHCIRCHVDGGVAPWSMTDYNTVMGWSSMMEQVLLSKRMPPWKADPTIGVFSNSFALNPEKRRKIIRWINEGMTYGSGDDPLKKISSEEVLVSEWERIPDTTIILRKEIIPASGLLEYRHQKIPINYAKGKWLAGVTIESGNLKVVHHATLSSSIRPELAVDRPERPWIDNLIAVYLSGSSKTTMFPDESGIYIAPDNALILQTHYTVTGRVEEDISKIHLYFHKEKPAQEYFPLAVATYDFNIKPYSKSTNVIAQDQITEDIYVHSVLPHMHYRGKSAKISAIKPDGEVLELISVPDYNFNWQFLYTYEEPIFLPKGTLIKAEGVFDNSFQNPLNPDPSQEIEFGYQSIDEMFNSSINYTLAKERSTVTTGDSELP